MNKIFLIFISAFLIFNNSFAQSVYDKLLEAGIGVTTLLSTDNYVYAAGHSYNHLYVVKQNLNGQTLWQKFFAVSGMQGYNVIRMKEGTGGMLVVLLKNHDAGKFMLVNITSSGIFSSAMDYNFGSTFTSVCDLEIDPAGNAYVLCENFAVFKIDVSGNVLWSRRWINNTYFAPDDFMSSITYTPSGKLLVHGVSFKDDSTTFPWYHYYFSFHMIDTSGLIVSTKVLADPSNPGYELYPGNVIYRNDNKIIFSARFQIPTSANLRGLVVKVDTSGQVAWARSIIPSTNVSRITAQSFTNNSTLVVSPGALNNDIAMTKIDDSGNYIWHRKYGNTSNWAYFSNLVVTPDSGIVFSGDRYGLFYILKLDSSCIFPCNMSTETNWSMSYSPTLTTPITYSVTSPVVSVSTLSSTDSIGSHEYTPCMPTSTDVNLIEESSVLSPNPFTTQTTISFNKEVYNATFSFYNLLGEKVAEVIGINGESYRFNRGNLRSGVYVFEVREGKSIWRGKAVVY